MVCTNCGAEAGAQDHRLLFASTDGDTKELDLTLCDVCLRTMLDEAGIEKASKQPRATIG